MRNACSSESSRRGLPVRLRRSPTTTQSRSLKAIAGCGRVRNQPLSTRPASSRVSAASAAGRRHNGRSRQALGVCAGMRSGASPGSPTSWTSCASGRPLKRQRPYDFHTSSSPRSPSSRAARCASGSAVAESRICPGRANAIKRPASGFARPSTSSDFEPRRTASRLFSHTSTSPTCRPARACRACLCSRPRSRRPRT